MQKQDVLTIPSELAHTQNAKKTKFIIGGVLIALAIVYLIFTAIQSTSAYFLTIDELQTQTAIAARQVRVSGMVDETSIDFNNTSLRLAFEITSETGERLPVVFQGPKPDQMRDGAEAIVEGTFDGEQFHAQTLLLKCPSRYDDGTIEQIEVKAIRTE